MTPRHYIFMAAYAAISSVFLFRIARRAIGKETDEERDRAFHRKVSGKRYTNVRDMLADMLDEKAADEIMARKDSTCKSPSTCTE